MQPRGALFLSLMVTSCSGERSFSRFKRIKNEFYSRNVPGEVVQSDKLRQTNCNEFLDNFVMKKARTKPFNCLLQWFPNYAPRHTAVPPDVIRCAAKNTEIKINQVEFVKFHPADFCQYSTLSILVVVIRYAAQCYDNRAIAYVATYRI